MSRARAFIFCSTCGRHLQYLVHARRDQPLSGLLRLAYFLYLRTGSAHKVVAVAPVDSFHLHLLFRVCLCRSSRRPKLHFAACVRSKSPSRLGTEQQTEGMH